MLDAVLRASIGGGFLAGIVWALCRLLPRLPPAARAALWWLAAAKFLIALAWISPLQLPVLPRADRASGAGLPVSGLVLEQGPELRAGSSVRSAEVAQPASGRNAGSPESSARSRQAMLLIWAAGAGIALGLAWHRYRRMRRLVAAASPAPPEVMELAAGVAARLGMKRTPGVRISDAIDTPLVTGLMRAVIVLPAARLSRLDVDRQRMVLCHELAHVKRRDLALGCVPALAERLFFFHPLAHLAAREFALWREAACDQTVLEVLGADPRDYGRLLLDLGVSRPRMALAAAGAPWSFQNLKRRLVMLGNPSSSSWTTRLLTGGVLCVSALALVPVQLVGRAALPAPSSPDSLTVVAQAAVATDAAPAGVPVARSENGAQERPAVPVPSPSKRSTSRSGTVGGDTFVLLVDGEGAMWHVSGRDHTRVRSLQRDGDPLLWFRRGGQEYVVRDRNVIEQAQAIWKPIDELGASMGELGGKMGALGAGQGKHGAEMGALGAKQGELGSRVGELALRQAALGLKGSRDLTDQERELADRQRRETEAELEKLEQQMEALGEQMKVLAKPMEDLEKQMEPLSRQMEELGRRMEEASKRAESDMEQLIERAIQDGTAQTVK